MKERKMNFFTGMSKFLCIFLVLLICLWQARTPAWAEEATEKYVLSGTVTQDELSSTVELKVSLNQNAGLHTLVFYVDYDSDVFQLVDVKKTKLIGDPYSFSESYSVSPYRCGWLASSSGMSASTGELVTLVFEYNELEDGNSYTFSFTNVKGGLSTIENNVPNINYVDFKPNPAVFTVGEGVNNLPGDVNLDGQVTAHDLTVLARHVAKIETIESEASLRNAEVSGNNRLSAKDLTILAQYVAKLISTLE